jgi:hypothetical protein
MAVDPRQVRQKAKAFVESLERLTAKQREQPPFAGYARDFNALLELAKEAVPDLDPRLWPQPLQIVDHGMGEQVLARYAEIETYARQIVNHIPTGISATVL